MTQLVIFMTLSLSVVSHHPVGWRNVTHQVHDLPLEWLLYTHKQGNPILEDMLQSGHSFGEMIVGIFFFAVQSHIKTHDRERSFLFGSNAFRHTLVCREHLMVIGWWTGESTQKAHPYRYHSHCDHPKQLHVLCRMLDVI